MKILVLGANGMAGHTISIYLAEVGHDILALTRKPFPYCDNLISDVSNFQKLCETIRKKNFDAIINCVGVLNSSADANKAAAICLNSYLPNFLAEITADLETKIVHLSTDCVFSGNTGPYTEKSLKDGKSFYDRSKALGEIDDCKNLTFRNSIIGPDLNPKGIGLFNWFMMQTGQIKGYSNAIWTGVTTLALADAIEKALKQNLSGLYHLVNNTSISKHDLLELINNHMRGGEVEIQQDASVVLDKTLINTRTDFLYQVPSYNKMVQESSEWCKRHGALYPCYFR